MDFRKMVPNAVLLIVVVLAVGAFLIIWNSIQSIFINKGIEIGHAQYEDTINDKNLEIMNQNKAIGLLEKDIEKSRENYRIELSQITSDHEVDKKNLRSKSAKELIKINARLEDVLIEKEKDELLINSQEITIVNLRGQTEKILKDWEQSDIKLKAAFNKKFALQEEKFKVCNNYTLRLEKKLKKRDGFLHLVGEAAKIGAAFYIGTKVK